MSFRRDASCLSFKFYLLTTKNDAVSIGVSKPKRSRFVSSVNGKTSKKRHGGSCRFDAKRHDVPCFSFKFTYKTT